MKLTKSPLFYFFLFLFGICAVWDMLLQNNPDKFTPWNYGFTIIYGSVFLSGALIGIVNAIRFGIRSTVGKSLLSLGLGLLSWQIGLWIWVYYNIVLNVEVPFPSLADFFFVFTFYPFLIYGCYNLLQLYTPKIQRHIKIEAVVVLIVSIIVVFGFLIKPVIDPELIFFGKADIITYVMGDAVLVSIAIISLRIGGRHIHPSLLLLVIGFFIQFIGDYVFTMRSNQGIYWNGDIADIFYTLAGFTMSLGVLEVVQSLDVKSSG